MNICCSLLHSNDLVSELGELGLALFSIEHDVEIGGVWLSLSADLKRPSSDHDEASRECPIMGVSARVGFKDERPFHHHGCQVRLGVVRSTFHVGDGVHINHQVEASGDMERVSRAWGVVHPPALWIAEFADVLDINVSGGGTALAGDQHLKGSGGNWGISPASGALDMGVCGGSYDASHSVDCNSYVLLHCPEPVSIDIKSLASFPVDEVFAQTGDLRGGV